MTATIVKLGAHKGKPLASRAELPAPDRLAGTLYKALEAVVDRLDQLIAQQAAALARLPTNLDNPGHADTTRTLQLAIDETSLGLDEIRRLFETMAKIARGANPAAGRSEP